MKNFILWVTDRKILDDFKDLNLKNHNFSIYESDTNSTKFKLVAREMRKFGTTRVLKINNDYTFELIFKRNSVWSSIKYLDLITNWMIINEVSPVYDDVSPPKGIFSGKKTDIEYPFEINKENLNSFSKILDFYMQEDSLKKIYDLGESTITSHVTLVNEKVKGYDEILNKLESNTLKGVDVKNYSFSQEEGIIINTNFGEIKISRNGEFTKIDSILKSENKDIAELFSFSKGTIKNIESHLINDIVTLNPPKKITKKNIISWMLSFMVLILLLIITFNVVLRPGNTGYAMKIMFSGYTWCNPWIYLMLINFLISLFILPIIAIVFLKASNPKAKVDLKWQMHIFISAQIRLVAVFLTGNSIFATIVWGWYVSSTRGVRVVSFIGMVASVNIIRGVIMIPIGILFMINGTLFNHSIFSEMDIMSQYYAYVTLAWIGWIWHIIHNLALTLLLILPPLHILYNKFLFIKYRNEGDSDIIINKFTTFEMNLIHLKHSFRNVFSDRKRISRMSLTMIILIVLETFEFTFSLRMVEDYALMNGVINSTSSYWNIFSISSVRYMSGFIHHVPILNLLPGQGLGITEIVLSTSTEGVINHAHLGEGLESSTISNLSEQTTFIIRFFNFYLKRIIALIVTMVFIPKAIIKRKMKINEGNI